MVCALISVAQLATFNQLHAALNTSENNQNIHKSWHFDRIINKIY